MKFFRFIISKSFWISLFLMALLSIVGVFVFFNIIIKSWTNHQEYVTLNDLSGMTLEKAIELIEERNLRYEIIDSSSYNEEKQPLEVISQTPPPFSKVKEGRKIYISLNASQPPMVEVPYVLGKSYEMAQIYIENKGLKLTDPIYKYSAEKNAVLGVYVDSLLIDSGYFLPKGSHITLEVGAGLGDTRISVPCLLGKTIDEAQWIIEAHDLILGFALFDTIGVIDSSSVLVYKQIPACRDGASIRIGETIDLFLSQDIPAYLIDSTQYNQQDTLDLLDEGTE